MSVKESNEAVIVPEEEDNETVIVPEEEDNETVIVPEVMETAVMSQEDTQVSESTEEVDKQVYFKKAKKAFKRNKYFDAYKQISIYFQKVNNRASEIPDNVRDFFAKLIYEMSTNLEDTAQAKMTKIYEHALALFPENPLILTSMGIFMYKKWQVQLARFYFEKALEIDEHCLIAERLLMNVKWIQLPRWHFRMLNDKPRNEAYRSAIKSMVEKGYKDVIDLGAGCGLLSLIAGELPGTNVIAIEENDILSKMCKEIVKKHNMKNVKVLRTHSTDLEEPEGKCNLLVTETFDCALFGEGALKTIHHALRILRTEKDFKIIPCRAKLYVAGVYCPYLYNNHKLTLEKTMELLKIPGVCLTQHNSEPYDSEDLSETYIKFLTKTLQVIEVDFYNIKKMGKLLNKFRPREIEFKAIAEGELQAFVAWFDLHLTDTITITTNPLDPNRIRCWEQAVFYVDHPVVLGDSLKSVKVRLNMEDSKLTITPLWSVDHTCFKASKNVITYLNDEYIVDCMTEVARKYLNMSLPVFDIGVFPLFGFLMLIYGKRSTLYPYFGNKKDKQIWHHVIRENNIPNSKFRVSTDAQSLRITGHILLDDPVETDGSPKNILPDTSHMSRGGIFIPEKLTVSVQVISSEYLRVCNFVSDENVFGFKISEFMNQFSGHEHPDLTFPHFSVLSAPVEFPIEEEREECKMVNIVATGWCHALLVWYNFHLPDRKTLSTIHSSHYRKTTYLVKLPKYVKAGEYVEVKMKVAKKQLKFSI